MKNSACRKSSLAAGIVKPFGPNHCIRRSRSVHAFHTRSRGAISELARNDERLGQRPGQMFAEPFQGLLAALDGTEFSWTTKSRSDADENTHPGHHPRFVRRQRSQNVHVAVKGCARPFLASAAVRENNALRRDNFFENTLLFGCFAPSGPRITCFHSPPTRKSIVSIVSMKPRGPHHFTTCCGLVIASQTSSRGALKSREMKISRSAFSTKSLSDVPTIFVQPPSKFLRARTEGSFRKCLQTLVRQFQFRFAACGKQFERDQRIAVVSVISPGVGQFLLRNRLGDFAAMVISAAFVFDDELKFKTRLRFEFLQVKIPAAHLVRIRERLPNRRNGARQKSVPEPALPPDCFWCS